MVLNKYVPLPCEYIAGEVHTDAADGTMLLPVFTRLQVLQQHNR